MPALRDDEAPHCGRSRILAYHNAIVLMAIVVCIVGQRCLGVRCLHCLALSWLRCIVVGSVVFRARWLPLCSLEKR